jgi:integrase
VIHIPGDGQKSGKAQAWPCPPDFAELLAATPEAARRGFVFELPPVRDRGHSMTVRQVGRMVAIIGERAGVVTGTEADGAKRFATAHDLRRSFGDRWSRCVMPVTLQAMMRHASIQTTLRYYVGRGVEEASAAMREGFRVMQSTKGAAPSALPSAEHSETENEETRRDTNGDRVSS